MTVRRSRARTPWIPGLGRCVAFHALAVTRYHRAWDSGGGLWSDSPQGPFGRLTLKRSATSSVSAGARAERDLAAVVGGHDRDARRAAHDGAAHRAALAADEAAHYGSRRREAADEARVLLPGGRRAQHERPGAQGDAARRREARTDSSASVMRPRPSESSAGAASVTYPLKRAPDGTASTPSIRTGLVDSAAKRVADARRLGAERRLERQPQARARGNGHAQARLAAQCAAEDARRLLEDEPAALAGDARLLRRGRRRRRRSSAATSTSGGQRGRARRACRARRAPAPGGRATRSAAPGAARRRQRRRRARGPPSAPRPRVVWPAVRSASTSCGARGVARGRVLRHRARQDRSDLERQAGRGEVHGRRLLGEDLHQDHRDALALEGLRARSGTRRARSRARRGRSGRRPARPSPAPATCSSACP